MIPRGRGFLAWLRTFNRGISALRQYPLGRISMFIDAFAQVSERSHEAEISVTQRGTSTVHSVLIPHS
jgi:hypothetical protein